jgi:hypothetical protein
MKRLWQGVATLFVVVPTALFGVFLWFNWGTAVVFPTDDPRLIKLVLPLNHYLQTGVAEALFGAFVFGAFMGVLFTLITFAAGGLAARETISALQADKRRLAAANRALEAAVPALRERFDEAIGAFDPHDAALTSPIGAAASQDDDPTAGVDIQQLAIEDAQRRRGSRGTS